MNKHDHEQIVSEEFNKVGFERGESMAKGHDEFLQAVLKHWQLDENSQVLDVGCGVGLALQKIHEQFSVTEDQLAGVDLSLEMCNQAKKRLPEASIHMTSAEHLPFADNTFTHVISIESLYYHFDPLKSLLEIHRTMKPGARFDCVIEFFKENRGTQVWQTQLNTPLKLWSSDEWKDVLKKANFQNVFHDIILRDEFDNLKSESEFTPSQFTPTYEHYKKSLADGGLWLKAQA